MDSRKRISGALCLLLFAGASGAIAADPAPPLKEVFDLLRTNLTDISETQLNRAAVQGLIDQLAPRVKLISESQRAGASTADVAVSGRAFDREFAYLRVSHLRPGVAEELGRVYDSLASSNQLKGIVIDLRFAEGDDYAAALAAANWFIASEQPLIDWGEGMKKSAAREQALKVPITVLVNKKTSGAAEALAAMLRHADIALVLGTNTAGNAAVATDLALSTGQHLHVYATPIKLGNGQPLPLSGLKPDIEVEVNEQDELAYLGDAYKVIPRPGPAAQ
jgi:C-terminal processing protease CtpA/Prc